MIRDIKQLTDTQFDLLVIGGGINGAVLSYMASLSGLSVALIDQGDFAQATSANSQKIIHGGLRYLQNLDILRIRQSLKERKNLMWLAPHLVHPLSCTMPLYGHGMKGREAMWTGLRLFDLIGRKRNETPDTSKFIPSGKILSVADTNELIPDLSQKGLNGSAQWYDAICYNTERLVLAYVKSAHTLGAVAANYVRAQKIIKTKNSIIVVSSQDKLSGQTFDILTKSVINITGPWVNDLINLSKLTPVTPQATFACGVNIITNQLFPHSTAVALKNPLDNKSRLYFVVPWRGKSIIGTEWFDYHGHPDNFKVTEQQCSELIAGFNSAYPPAQIKLNDILHVHGGLVPCSQKHVNSSKDASILKHFQTINHSRNGTKEIVSVIGVKYTTGGDVAQKVLQYMFPSITIKPPLSRPQLKGGEIANFLQFQNALVRQWKSKVPENELLHLSLNYGTETEKIIKIAIDENTANNDKSLTPADTLKAETIFAIKEEMAQKLADVVMRRTDRGTSGNIKGSDLTTISRLMAGKLGWSEEYRMSEIKEVNNYYPSFIQQTIDN
jgi:glycerol-3-phosphate dehydrogenase